MSTALSAEIIAVTAELATKTVNHADATKLTLISLASSFALTLSQILKNERPAKRLLKWILRTNLRLQHKANRHKRHG